jgi:flagellar hook protein FlgE
MDISNVASAAVSGLNGFKAAEQGIASASSNINKIQTERETVAANERVDGERKIDNNNLEALSSQAKPVSLTTEVVNLAVNEYQAKASAKVIKTADDVVGTLIDTTA